ncbi:MAG: DUF3800 domain-containing protein [Gemmataceae bacterium]
MLVFVDESGDTGMKLGRGSTPCFAVTAVFFRDHKVAQACSEAINDLRTRLRFTRGKEFKFSKCHRDIRLAFLNAVVNFEFCYHSFVLNKCNLSGPGFFVKESHYKAPIKYLFDNASDLLPGAKVVFDEFGGREFNDQLTRYLKKRLVGKDGNCPIRKFDPQPSHKNNLIQLADMVCGAVARSFKEDKADQHDYRRVIKRREIRVQFWPDYAHKKAR